MDLVNGYNISEIVEEIISTVFNISHIESNHWARKPRKGFDGCTIFTFIEKVLTYETSKEFLKYENWGQQTLHRTFARIFVPIFGKIHGGNQTWARILLNSVEIKLCPHCCRYLKYISYDIDRSNVYNTDSICKECKSIKNAKHYSLAKYTYHRPYIEEHQQEYNARNAKRRAAKLNATPSWANLDIIKEIYNNCPKGYHVDHIVPLQGKEVCGLHVEYNLQYLPALENMKKGNKLYNEGVEK